MEAKERAARDLRVMLLSAMSVALAPFVLLGLLMIRMLKPRLRFFFRHWNRRVQREIARWS
jgi:F0F1-type ATP synthase membrane subunit b/b'